MNKTHELLNSLLEHVESGEHIKFQFIRTWREYLELRANKRVLHSVIKSLLASKSITFKHYCKDIESGNQQFNKLLACNALSSAATFYSEDLSILIDMLDEYETYLISGNLADIFLLDTRPDSELWDHRSD